MNWVVSEILDFLLKNKVISDEKEIVDFYHYGIEITISSCLNIVLILLLGVITGHIIESILYLVIFICVRSLIGGYHAKTYFRCNMLMCVTFLMVTYISDKLLPVLNLAAVVAIAVVSIITIALFSPVENRNKSIEDKRKGMLKVYGTIVSIVISVVSIVLIMHNVKIGRITLMTLFLIALLIIAAKIEERRANI